MICGSGLVIRFGIFYLDALADNKILHYNKTMKENTIKLFIPAKSDVIFKIIFGDELNKLFLIMFLEAVLDLEFDEYTDIQIVDPHLKRKGKDDKFGILDVKIRTKTGKIINIEIQLQVTPEMRERIVYYGAKLITEQLQSGDEYALIRKTISILITGDIFLREHSKYHDVFKLYSQLTGTEFTDILEIHTLELSKLPRETDGSDLWAWLEFMNAESEEELMVLREKEPKLRAAVEKLLEINRDPDMRALYDAREKERRDNKARERYAMQRGKSEGIAEGKVLGIAEGIERGKLEGIMEGIGRGKAEGERANGILVARRAIAMGMSVEDIVRLTGISSDELEGLME